MSVLSRLFHFIRPYLGSLVFSLILLIFAGAFEVLNISLVIPLFDKVLNVGQNATNIGIQKLAFLQLLQKGLSLIPGSTITQLAVALLILTFFKGICLYYSNYSMSHVGQSVVTDLRVQLYEHVLNQSMAFFSLSPFSTSTNFLILRAGFSMGIVTRPFFST